MEESNHMQKNVEDLPSIQTATRLISQVKNAKLSLNERVAKSIELAGHMIEASSHLLEPIEQKKQSELARMMKDPHGKAFTTALTDQCFRSKNNTRIAEQMRFILKKFGVPQYLSPMKRFQLQLFKSFGHIAPFITVPLAIQSLRKETSLVIIPGEPKKLQKHIRKRKEEGIRLNVNHLGEAILGEEEANHRVHVYLNDLLSDDVDYISIKISTIYSQINLTSYEYSLTKIAERLRLLYRAAKKNPRILPNGESEYKFVNLDMEEYKDLDLTIDVFKKVLDEEEFHDLPAGIVLQAYIPDSFALQQSLTEWAMKRRARGGAPIKIRIVKGANMAMERFEASLRHWPQTPYQTKVETDANYKRMVIYGLQKKHAEAVHIGIASHNLFDIAFALLLRSEQGVEREVNFEMLEGMANHMRRVVHTLSGGMLLYCAVATKKDFQSAIAYLIRRLDENTGIDNFLAHSFGLIKDSPEWKGQVAIFEKACSMIDSVSASPRRSQDRGKPPYHLPLNSPFINEPDTDFSLPQNRAWLEEIMHKASHMKEELVGLSIDGKLIARKDETGFDPSVPSHIAYYSTLASWEELDKAIGYASGQEKHTAALTAEKRIEHIHRFAQLLRIHRGDLIAKMIVDGGKNPVEADVEISEAIDFAEYYIRSLQELLSYKDISWTPVGLTLVTPPWNFPLAIPAGGVIAAYLAGNPVLFKPARETNLVGHALCALFWEAGISQKDLQFIQCNEDEIGSRLIEDPRIKSIILTGATSTAKFFLKKSPSVRLCAETGGKNAIIVSALSDRDLAIKDITHSAFGHAGQKCSACSIVILEKEVYDDPDFLRQLRDAVLSLHVGSAHQGRNKVTPLIHPPRGALYRALTELEPGEKWLVEPKIDPANPRIVSPGIKIGVRPGSFTHMTEFFGPVLGIIRADSIKHAIEIANMTPYGLTSGLHSLDPRELLLWEKSIVAGNLYINRGITGAIVQRQPFGGCKESCFGPGHKAGGPQYLMQFMIPHQKGTPSKLATPHHSVASLSKAIEQLHLSEDEIGFFYTAASSYAHWAHEFHTSKDPTKIAGQDNLFEYRPHTHYHCRISEHDAPAKVLAVFAAALSCGVVLEVSWNSPIGHLDWKRLLPSFHFHQESESHFIERIGNESIRKIRMLHSPSEPLLRAAAEHGCYINTTPPVTNGRIELLHYLREVSLSIDYHRYGSLGEREHETRSPIL